jgi:hypothetical protein
MITCKNVARLLTSDEFHALGGWRRAEIRLHLMMCKHCSRLARQLRQMGAAVRHMPDSADPDLEDRIIGRLSKRE